MLLNMACMLAEVQAIGSNAPFLLLDLFLSEVAT